MGNISIGGRISLLQRVASLDLRYGPYSSIADAFQSMGPSGDDIITASLPFGVTEDDGSVSVYVWTKGEGATQNDCKKLDKEHIVLFNGFIDISVSVNQQSYNNIATKDNIVFISDRKQFAYRDGLNFYINWKNRYVWSNENLVPYYDVIYIDISDNKTYYYNGTTLTLLASETFVSSVNNQSPDENGNVNITKEHIGLENVDNTADANKIVKGASEDGSGNIITVTYETKTDATTKQTTLQGAINALQTSVAALTGLDSTNFGGFSIESTEADAISNIATLYTADGYTDELLWYMAGTSLSSVKAYRYNGSGTPTAISSDTYNCVDFSGLIADVSTLSQNLSALGPKISQNETKLREIKNAVQGLDGDTLYIVDGKGNVVAYIGAQGLVAVEVQAQGKKLSNIPNDILESFYPNRFYVTDGGGNVVAYIDEDGVHAIGIYADNLNENKWYGKVLATYGDSVTALNGGNFTRPYSSSVQNAKWSNKVANFFKFDKIYNRGIGSTCFKYRNHGGQVAWVKTATGVYVDRNDSYNYDNYEGSVTIPSDCTPIRGDGSSWLRITSMFPESIKDEVDVVLIMYHNDFHQDMDTDAAWVENDTTDPEWAASSYYETYGGDYNIASVKGGIASVIMKMQAWMPNALLVLMTPISGVYSNGNEDVKDLENVESAKMKKLAECVKDVAFRMSIPCIDVYGNDGINSLNKVLRNYITDGIHPYSDAGCKQIARAVASGLSSIVPNF